MEVSRDRVIIGCFFVRQNMMVVFAGDRGGFSWPTNVGPEDFR